MLQLAIPTITNGKSRLSECYDLKTGRSKISQDGKIRFLRSRVGLTHFSLYVHFMLEEKYGKLMALNDFVRKA